MAKAPPSFAFPTAKLQQNVGLRARNKKIFSILIKKLGKVLAVSEKVVPLHPQNGNAGAFQCKVTLGYGVMVTLQILVLSFLVRVRVPQHDNEIAKKSKHRQLGNFSFNKY